MRFVSRLLKPSVFAGCAAIAVGVVIGSTLAHNALYAEISADQGIERAEWERWVGINTQSIVPYILFGAEASYLLVMALLPDRNERSAIKRYARKRLADPLAMGDGELQLWNRVLKEVDNDEYL